MIDGHNIKDDCLYDTNEISAIVGVHKETIRVWIRKGSLPAKKSPGQWKVLGRDLKKFLGEEERG